MVVNKITFFIKCPPSMKNSLYYYPAKEKMKTNTGFAKIIIYPTKFFTKAVNI